MTYHQWLESVPLEISNDPLWKMEAYRLSLFVCETGWHDVSRLMQVRRTISLSDQLYRALGSIGGNVSEGYSRGSGKDRARFYEYALGSARESRHWYYNGRHVLGDSVALHRSRVQSHIIRLLLAMIPDQRGYSLQEAGFTYCGLPTEASAEMSSNQDVAELLCDVPLA